MHAILDTKIYYKLTLFNAYFTSLYMCGVWRYYSQRAYGASAVPLRCLQKPESTLLLDRAQAHVSVSCARLDCAYMRHCCFCALLTIVSKWFTNKLNESRYSEIYK